MKPLTTTEAAKACSVSVATLKKWIARGMLKAWCVPGSPYRRIEREELERFKKQWGLP